LGLCGLFWVFLNFFELFERSASGKIQKNTGNN